MGNVCFACKWKAIENNHNSRSKELTDENVIVEMKEFSNERKAAKISLRAVSQCSLKPGRIHSLITQPSQSKAYGNIATSIDPDDFISIHDMYNMLNDGGIRSYIHDPYNLLLIDCRKMQDYSCKHIITAKHHNKIMEDFTMRLPCYSMVIVYGDEIKDNQNTVDLVHLRSQVQEYIAGDVLVLTQGFDIFLQRYPFLCTERDIETIADRKKLITYPSIILDKQLFQGRGDQATNETIIDLLNITHVVNITLEHKNAFPKKVKYLKLAIEDVSESDLFEHFEKTSEFIEKALSKGRRVFVHCTQGISRSSTITLAYLIKYKRWSLEMAYSTLKARRSCACPNAGFLKQLSEWEFKVFGRMVTDIDTL